MKESERKINFRLELAEQLKTILYQANDLYEVNYQWMWYRLYADIFRDSIRELYEALMASAECHKGHLSGIEEFELNYKDILEKHGIEICSEARAASYIFRVYEKIFQSQKEKVLQGTLTKAEQLQIKRFFTILIAPLKNPNIQIPEGKTKCLYDRDYRHSFSKDMKSSLEYINQECSQIIELFNTPEEMEKIEIQKPVFSR